MLAFTGLADEGALQIGEPIEDRARFGPPH
jgi:hypothetical protein